MPCACNSGKIYQECCELHHTNTFGIYTAANNEGEVSAELAIGSPEGILRARYTGKFSSSTFSYLKAHLGALSEIG